MNFILIIFLIFTVLLATCTHLTESALKMTSPLVPSLALMIIWDTMPVLPDVVVNKTVIITHKKHLCREKFNLVCQTTNQKKILKNVEKNEYDIK